MRLRTLTGQRWPARCADGCGTVIPPGPDVRVVVDFDAHPRKTWIPAHSPDAGTWKGNGSTAQPAPTKDGNRHAAAFTPASALPPTVPATPPKAPEPPAPPRAPAPPAPLALLGSEFAHSDEEASPSPQAGRAWSSGGLTVNAGKFESVRAGYADYALPGETAEQLGVRVNAVIEADLRAKLALLVRLHREFGIPGPEYLRPTSSAPASAGAPQGALASPSPPSSARASVAPRGPGTAGGEGAPARPCGPGDRGEPTTTVADLVARVQFEMTDQGVKRSVAKKNATQKLLELRGLRSLRECGSADEKALRALLVIFEQIDSWDLHAALGVPAPQLDERLVLPA